MKFLHPNILWFLLLLIIPIIIHLFNFRRYKKIYFSSLQFIKKVEKETNSTRNLRHYLILASRLLALTALILAFAQPYLPSSNQSDSLGSVVPIYLDNSFSMSAKGNNGDLLNQAKETIDKITENFPKEQKYLFVTNNLDGSELRVINRSELKDKLDDIQLSPIFRSVTSPLSSAYEHLSSLNHDKELQYFVISDFQKVNLKDDNLSVDTSAYYSLIQLKPQIERNLYIDSVWFDQPFQRININNNLNVRIQNTSNEELTNVEVNLEIGETKRQTLIDIAANNYTIIELNYTDKTTGVKSGKIEILDENLHFDNKFYFNYEVKESIQVLIINDQNSMPYPKMVYQTDDYYQIQQTNLNQLKTEELNTADLIVLNGLNRISSGIITQLNQLVEHGIHLLIIPSSNFEKESYNNLLSSFQLPLIQSSVKQDIRIGKINTEYSFFQGMFDKKVDELRMPSLKSYLSSTVYSNANFNALIQYENGMPLLVEKSNGNNVFALYTAIDPDFNNFGKTALFSAISLRISEISQGKSPLYLTIGSSDNYLVRNKTQGDHTVLLKQNEIEFIPEMSNQSGFTSISVRHSSDNQSIGDGIYNILSNDKELGKLALNFNRIESDMEYANLEELNNFFKALGVNKLKASEVATINDIHQLTLYKPSEYWRILLILAIGFFLLEMLLIIFWKS